MRTSLFILIASLFITVDMFGQCASLANIYSFTYDNRTYEIVKEQKDYVAAVNCAIERGGILVEINDQAEQDAVWNAIQAAGISTSYTSVSDGDGIAYIWIGASDRGGEGYWYMNGDNDAVGIHFYQGEGAGGANNGVVINNEYNNWGGKSTGTVYEPDNSLNQDAAGIGLEAWPSGVGSSGIAGEWNDLKESNTLYYVIEYDFNSGINDPSHNIKFNVYPVPTTDFVSIDIELNEYTEDVTLEIVDSKGEVIYQNEFSGSKIADQINVSQLSKGVYFMRLNVDGKMYLNNFILQ